MMTVSNPSSFLSKDLQANRVRTMIGAGQKLKWRWWGNLYLGTILWLSQRYRSGLQRSSAPVEAGEVGRKINLRILFASFWSNQSSLEFLF